MVTTSSGRFLTDLKQLIRPYYLVNLILSLSFIALKLTPPFCNWIFIPASSSDSACELDMRENEVLFFLLIVIMIRARKTGSMNMLSYLSSGFVYAKGANMLLFFRADPRLGLIYLLLFILQGVLLPEPTYKGPENLVYFRASGLQDELKRDPRITWLVTFYAAWSPSSINFAPIFSKLSGCYALPNLKFGKIDVGRYPEVAEQFIINTSSLTRQLPTIIMFQGGKEVGRVPAIIGGKVQKFMFKEEDVINVFDLNNLHSECKKDKKYINKIESKKDK